MFHQLTYTMLSARLSEEQAKAVLAFSGRLWIVHVVIIPVFLLVKLAFVAALIYFLSILLDGPNKLSYPAFFSVTVYSEMIPLLMSVVNLLILYVKGISSIQNPTDLQAIVGLDFLLMHKMANLPLYTLLNSINIFTIWYLATLTAGVSVVTGFRKAKAWLIVVGVWLVGLTFEVVMIAFSSNLLAHPGM